MLSVAFTNVHAQQNRVTFTVVGAQRQAVPFATVKAFPLNDSINIVQRVTDSSGVVVLELVKGLQYIVRISSVNFKAAEKRISVTGNQAFVVSLAANSGSLNTVVVTTTRPLMRQEDDKTIVDPENLASSSTNSYEVLEKTPGLFVDQDGNVYLSSTTPAKVYINGREQKMSTADIATILKSLPPNSIASIEILRTPSAKYDASGVGGIVNVVLKKGVRIGLTGTATVGLNQGVYGNQFVGLNLNNGTGKLNSYINTQYSRRNSYDQTKTDRLFATDSMLSQDAFSRYPGSSFYVGYGLGYELNSKWEVNYDGRVSFNSFNNNTLNGSDIKKISTAGLITSNTSAVQNKGNGVSFTQGLNSKYKIDSAGSEWTNDVSFTSSPNRSNQDFTTTYLRPAYTPLVGNGDINTRFQYFSAATNLLLKLPKKVTVETGLKSTVSNFYNDAQYYKENNGSHVVDAFRTAYFKYNENINSAYLQASKDFMGVLVKVGSRVENTNMEGHQLVPKDTSFNIHRTDFFPYVFLSRDVMSIMSYKLRAYLVYRRTISRPSYDLLNPFPRYIDQYLFETGNPALRPQFTQNYEANVSVGERPVFAIGLNDTKDIFTNVIYQADSSRSLAYRTYDNLGSNKETYFRVLGAIPPGKKVFIVLGAQYNHNFYNGLYESKPLNFKRGSWSIFTYQNFKVTKNTQVTINGFARFNGQLQFYELSSFGSLNMSINRLFFNKTLMVALSATDLLFTNKNRFTLNQGTVSASGLRMSDTRRVGLNIRYNFGFRKKEENNMFDIESPEKTN